MKKTVKIISAILCLIVVIFLGFIAYLSITNYTPDKIEDISITNEDTAAAALTLNSEVTLLTLNTGYAALDKESDFFMDGGTGVLAFSEEKVKENLSGITDIINKSEADIVFLQEVDEDSKRTFNINEKEYFASSFSGSYAFAYNYKCNYVPYPLPTLGKINSGIMTLNSYNSETAQRISLPIPFKWPISMCNLKRCLLVEYVDIEGSENKLVLINLHLEAYDDGEGKLEQTEMLMNLIREEYEKGNYVIAGGDFNQTFPNTDKYPLLNEDYWNAGRLYEESLPEGFKYIFDDTYPTCRLLNKPYDSENTTSNQYYVIDGFIVSPNVEVTKIETLNENFTYTDHSPVKMNFYLKSEE